MDSTRSTTAPWWDRLTVCIFWAAISLPIVFSAVSGHRNLSVTENRALADPPGLPTSIQDLKSFPRAFETYFNDHFGMRYQFVSVSNHLVRLLNDSPSENVVEGKQGWLFLRGEKHFSPLRDSQNLDLFTEFELQVYCASIVEKYHWLKDRGIAYLYVVAPNKHTIYSDMLPSYIEKQNPDSALTQFAAYMRANTDVPVLDLREALMAYRRSGSFPVYDKFDTHWNLYGANVAQYEILKKIASLFPGKMAAPHLYADEDFKMVDVRSGDLAGLMGKTASEFKGYQVPQLLCLPPPHKVIGTTGPSDHVITCDGGKLSAVIFRDSFFSQLQPYVTPYFSRAKYISSYRPTIADIRRHLKTEHPDIIIEELVERFLPVKLSAFEKIDTALTPEEIRHGRSIYDLESTGSVAIKLNEMSMIARKDKKQGVHLESTGTDPQLVLTGLKFQSGKKYLLEMDIRSDQESYVQFFWTTGRNIGRFTQADSFRQFLEKGENHLSFLTGNIRLDPNLRIDFGEQPAQFSLGRLTIVELSH